MKRSLNIWGILFGAVIAAAGMVASCGSGDSTPSRNNGAAGSSGSNPGGTGGGGGAGGGGTSSGGGGTSSGGGGTSNGGGGAGGVTTCAPETDSAFCTRLGKACGSVTDIDNCVVSRTVAVCGACTPPATCGAANTCGCAAETDTAFCTRVGRNCGAVTDIDTCGVSRTVASCGTCTAPDVCSAGHVCGPANCVAETDTVFCTRMHDTCGAVTSTDNCGTARTVASCGTCTAPQTCGATHTCACVPEDSATFCARLAKTCGTVTAPDNCGTSRIVTSCGTCATGTCGAANTCSCAPEDDATFCLRLGKSCGSVTAPDNCGASRTVASCGVCVAPQTCGAANVCTGGTTTTGGAICTNVADPVLPAPAGQRLTYNFNYGWKYLKQDVPAASAAAFDDSAWTDVTLPHTYNDVDNYGVNWTGDVSGTYSKLSWYRKHFTVDASQIGKKVFVELTGIRDAATVYVNGKNIGFHQDEVSPGGFDITSAVTAGDNVIAVQINGNDNQPDQTVAVGYSYKWSTISFYPRYQGLVGDANLYITAPLHQTLPLWNNLKTQGIYVYADPSTIDTAAKSATVTVESEVFNESNTAQSVSLAIEIFDRDGASVGTAASAAAQQVAAGAKVVIKAQKALTGVHFWAPNYPYLYTVRSTISVGGTAIDSTDIPSGIRKFSFNTDKGLKINGHSIFLAGFAPRTVMDWPGSGIAQDWMIDLDYLQMKAANHFFIRPMHVAPRPHMMTSADRLGVIMVVPAGSGEYCPDDARWPQVVALMQAVAIAYRNSPSFTFYEGCNGPLLENQMQQIKAVRDTWDPHGGRYVGARGRDRTVAPSMEYTSGMDSGGTDTVPTFGAEVARQESPRRVWDAYSPMFDPRTQTMIPSGGLIKLADPAIYGTALETANGGGIAQYPLCDFRLNSSEDQALCHAEKFWYDGIGTSAIYLPAATRAKGVTSGIAHIIYADSKTDGRLDKLEVARMGVVDGMRIPKESYYVHKVGASLTPDIHIIGHWNYDASVKKTVYVAASNVAKVTLAVYDANNTLIQDYGAGTVDAQTGRPIPYIYSWPNVQFKAGKIRAVGLDATGKTLVTDEHVTTGAPAALKLTPITGPKGWIADGADIAMVDVEVVDAAGLRVPIDTTKLTFQHSGAGTWIGGYNSGQAKIAYPNQGVYTDSIMTDAGINRIMVRSTRTAGSFAIKVSRAGLPDATIELASQPFTVPATNLVPTRSQRCNPALPAEPAAVPDN